MRVKNARTNNKVQSVPDKQPGSICAGQTTRFHPYRTNNQVQYVPDKLPGSIRAGQTTRFNPYLMVEEKDVLLQAPDVLPSLCAIVVHQVRVHVTDEAGDFRTHAVLHGKGGVRQMVVDEPLEERDVQVEATAQFVHGRRRSELLVVSDEDQVLALPVQGGHHVGFQHLQTHSHSQL